MRHATMITVHELINGFGAKEAIVFFLAVAVIVLARDGKKIFRRKKCNTTDGK